MGLHVSASTLLPTGLVAAVSGHPTLAFAILLSLPVAITFIYWTILYPFYLSPLRHLPGPSDNRLLLGQCHKFLQVAWVPQLFQEWSLQWPDAPMIRYLGIGNSETLVVNSLAAYRDVLQTKASYFVKPGFSRRTANVVIGDALPFAEGANHRHRRAVVSKPFSTQRIKNFVPVLQSKARRLVDVLGNERLANGEVEAEPHIWRSTLDVIGIETLGKDLNHLESKGSNLHELFGKTMQQSLMSHVVHFFSSYIPLRHLIPLKVNQEFLNAINASRDVMREHVVARRAAFEKGEKFDEETIDALQCMIEQGPMAWSDDEIVEYTLNLMILGHDTTACAIVWAFYTLSEHAEIQEKLREEVTKLTATHPNPTFAEIEALPYLENYLREVLRVYCPVAYVPREATADVTIAGELVPKGTCIQLSPSVLNMSPAIWGEDAAAFNPDRWDHLEGEAASAYAFETFHHGPRQCIGKQLSLAETKVVLIEILSRFRIEALEPGKELELASPSFTLRPKELLRVRLVDL